MKNKIEEFKEFIFRRSPDIELSNVSLDIKLFNIFCFLDGAKTVAHIAEEGLYDPEDLFGNLIKLYQMNLIEIVKSKKIKDRLDPTLKKSAPKVVPKQKDSPQIEDDVVGYVRSMLSNKGFNWN